MKTIIGCLKERIHDNDTIFVFPTQVAADSWAEKALEVTDCGSVALERFIAWDRFKEASVKSKVAFKKSVSSAVRSLFVHSLLALNAREKFFTSLVPEQFSSDYSPFAGWISRLLPSLALVKRKLAEKSTQNDAEDSDLLLLEQKYSRFLEENNLFEPAWEIPPFENNGKNYVIFYPEVIEDFDEYAALLVNSPHVDIRHVELEQPLPELNRFQNARLELSALMQTILRDHIEDGIGFDRIAVSVPGLEVIEPYLLRELRLHDIPFQFRSAKPLCGYAAGGLFSLMLQCVTENFSLAAVKRLLSQHVFPWRFPELNTLLLRFGEEHRCDCAVENTDVWLAAFRANPKEERLRTYYESLRSSLETAGEAKTFTALRTAYFTFRTRFFDTGLFEEKPDLFTAQTDAVMARCVEELGTLIQLEHEFPQLVAALSDSGESSPFTFFTSVLAQKQYLPREQGLGVHIFAYKAAACAPFERHYLINASQNDSSMLVRPLSFLSSEKRRSLGISEKNISGFFFLLYQSVSVKTVFSCAEKTFTGYASPHGWFLTRGALSEIAVKNAADSPEKNGETPHEQKSVSKTGGLQFAAYEPEWDWWANPAASDFPQRLFSVQKRGFFYHIEKEAPSQSENGRVFYDEKNSAAADILDKKIAAKKAREGTFKITASDMNAFVECRTRWLYERIFGLRDPETELQMVDALKLGSFYHAVIASVLKHSKETGKKLDPGDSETYSALITQAAKREAENSLLFGDFLPRLVMQTSLRSVIRILEDFFSFLTRAFAGSSVAEIEKKYAVPFADGSELSGTIDCLLFLNDGWCILDFKKNTLPQLSKYRDVPQNPLTDFQLPLYKRLFETANAKPGAVTQAAFVSIENPAKRLASVLGENPSSSRSRSLYASNEDFEPVMAAFDTAAAVYLETVSKTNSHFQMQDADFDICVKCPFNTICRTTYFISGDSHGI